MKIRDGFDALVEALQAVFFIGGMEVVAVEAESQKYHLNAQLFFEEMADGNAAAAAHRDGGFAKGCLDGFCRRLVGFGVDGSHIRFATEMFFCFYHNAFGAMDLK